MINNFILLKCKMIIKCENIWTGNMNYEVCLVKINEDLLEQKLIMNIIW